MQRLPPGEDDNENASLLRSPKPRSVASSRRLEELANGHGDEDIRSDVQEGNGSDVARTIPIQTTGLVSLIVLFPSQPTAHNMMDAAQPEHEPGPDDPPGPRFESYGSSFGNFGPLRDSLPPINGNGWNALVSTSNFLRSKEMR